MRVLPASLDDLPSIRAAYAHARALQQAHGFAGWPEFTDAEIRREIDDGLLFLVLDDGTLVGIFSVAYEDPAIWGERERGAHLYLHRIARAASAPARGGLVDAILAWARAHCRARGRAGLRIDTWASNPALIAHYERRGFALVERRRIGIDPRLPPRYHGLELALLEASCEPPRE